MTKKRHDHDTLDIDDPGHPDFPPREGADVDLGMGLHAKRAPGAKPAHQTIEAVINEYHATHNPPLVMSEFVTYAESQGWHLTPATDEAAPSPVPAAPAPAPAKPWPRPRSGLATVASEWNKHLVATREAAAAPRDPKDAAKPPPTPEQATAEFVTFVGDHGWKFTQATAIEPVDDPHELMAGWYRTCKDTTPDPDTVADHFNAYANPRGWYLTDVEPAPPPETKAAEEHA